MKKSILFTVVIAAIAFLGGYLFNSQSLQPLALKHMAAASVKNDEPISLSKSVAEVKTVAATKLVSVVKEPIAKQVGLEKGASSAEAASMKNIMEYMDSEDTQADLEFRAMRDLNEAFDNEEVDYEWSEEVTAQIQQAMSDNGIESNYSEIEHYDVECRYKLCKVTLYGLDSTNKKQDRQIPQVLADLANIEWREGDDRIPTLRPIDTIEENGMMAFFIFRTNYKYE